MCQDDDNGMLSEEQVGELKRGLIAFMDDYGFHDVQVDLQTEDDADCDMYKILSGESVSQKSIEVWLSAFLIETCGIPCHVSLNAVT